MLSTFVISKFVMRKKLLLLLLTVSSVAFGQDKKFLNPQLKFSAEYLPSSDLKDVADESFSYGKAQLGLVYPLISRRFSLTNDLEYKAFAVLINANGTYALPDYSFLNTTHQLISAVAGPSIIYNTGNKNTWLAGFTVGMAQDLELLSQTQIRFTGHALFKHKVSGNFSYHLGVVYSFVYGQPLPLPLIGCVVRTSNKSKLKISLPLSVAFYYKTNAYDMLSLFIQPDGDQYNFSAIGDTVFAGRDPLALRMRYRSFKSGLSYKIGVNDRWFITPEVGLSLARKITFTEGSITDKKTFISADVKPGPYVKLGVRFLLGDLKWKRTGDNFLLNDERLDYYDLDDPTKL